MSARFSGFLIAASLLLPAAAQAAGRRPIVAVFDVEAKGIELSGSLLERLSEYLSSRLAETGRYMVIPRDDLKKRLLGQKSKSYKQCYDRSCQIEMGREMASDKTIATQVIKFGSRCMLTSTLYDLKKAATEIAATVRGKCGEEELVSSLDKVVDKLSGKKDEVAQVGGGVFSKPEKKKVGKIFLKVGESNTSAKVHKPGTKLARRTYSLWGHISVWSGVGLLALGGTAAYMAASTGDDYDRYGNQGDLDASRNWSAAMWAGFGLGAALVTCGVVLWIVDPGPGDVTSIGAAPLPDGSGMALSLGGRW